MASSYMHKPSHDHPISSLHLLLTYHHLTMSQTYGHQQSNDIVVPCLSIIMSWINSSLTRVSPWHGGQRVRLTVAPLSFLPITRYSIGHTLQLLDWFSKLIGCYTSARVVGNSFKPIFLSCSPSFSLTFPSLPPSFARSLILFFPIPPVLSLPPSLPPSFYLPHLSNCPSHRWVTTYFSCLLKWRWEAKLSHGFLYFPQHSFMTYPTLKLIFKCFSWSSWFFLQPLLQYHLSCIWLPSSFSIYSTIDVFDLF